MTMEDTATYRAIKRLVYKFFEDWMKDKHFKMNLHATRKMRKLIEEQNKVGLDQVIRGRTRKELASIQGRHSKEKYHITKGHKTQTNG